MEKTPRVTCAVDEAVEATDPKHAPEQNHQVKTAIHKSSQTHEFAVNVERGTSSSMSSFSPPITWGPSSPSDDYYDFDLPVLGITGEEIKVPDLHLRSQHDTYRALKALNALR